MSSQDLFTKDRAEVESRLLIARYGSHRSAVGSTIFIWVNLSLLLALGWAMLVVVFDAPTGGVERLPLDWFVVRLMIVLTAAGLTMFLWRSSQASTFAASKEAVAGIFKRGVLWTQVMLFLVGVSLVLGVLLLIANPGQASRLLIFGVVEVFAIQALLSGYMKTAFDLLADRVRSFLVVTGLFAAFFGLQSVAIATTATDTGQNYLLALIAGGVLGVLVGVVSLVLRDRTGSILPGMLFHLLLFHLVITFVT